ncbi:hypothetical protein HNQ93_004034 [Hymenobacter luteus]|jgi:hypothetical protein|uniref:Uncharacterized protein n=4 Tax=Hymenobacteraceae TaxID=1853232 RepID=A0A7W9T582_9BACT|nr:hypothetical protein [Hymenobacter latericoloratus]MBB6061155.1 hypothetical protein [Hymenobacter luteus]SNS04765.1 hypothetical protein SAMN06269173_12029 [Hymenobacter mucosus]
MVRAKGMPNISVKPVATKRVLRPLLSPKPPNMPRWKNCYVERNSQRSIVHATGVARVTVAKLLKKARAASPPLPRLRRKKF